jgi:TPP-dependent pyruvate/acetoin dehydrogenase alpha subunit
MYRRWLVERAKVNQGMLIRIDEVAARQIEEAVKYAESLPFPKPETVADRLFAPSPHDPDTRERKTVYEPIETPAIPALMETKERSTGEHF